MGENNIYIYLFIYYKLSITPLLNTKILINHFTYLIKTKFNLKIFISNNKYIHLKNK